MIYLVISYIYLSAKEYIDGKSLKKFAVAHENARLSIGMYGILSELRYLFCLHARVCGPYREAA